MPGTTESRLLTTFPELAPVIKAKASMGRENGRYAFHCYLTEVYRVGRQWSREKIRKRQTRKLMQLAKIQAPRRLHAFRAIIEATLPGLDSKTASRWTRSIQYAMSSDVSTDELKDFFRAKGGMANCARLAALEIPMRRYRRSSWD